MKPKKYILHFTLGLLVLSGCFKEDDKVEPHQSGDVKTGIVTMTSTYKYQVYYDLGTAQAVKSNLKSDWDLGFSCEDSSMQIILNSSKFMWAFNVGLKEFPDVLDTAGIPGRFDVPSGNPDSVSIGEWGTQVGSRVIGNLDMYVIDRGLDELGLPQGMVRMMFDSLVNDTFYFRFSSFAPGGTVHKAYVVKDPDKNFSCFKLEGNGSLADIEPPKNDWDLHFTQYTTYYFTNTGDPYPYLVTGVLSNRYNVALVLDTTLAFEDIDLQLAQNLQLDTRYDVIGFDWKEYNFAQGTYVVKPQNIYIISDTEGYLYKLRFISFINDTGEKGFPTFEFVKL